MRGRQFMVPSPRLCSGRAFKFVRLHGLSALPRSRIGGSRAWSAKRRDSTTCLALPRSRIGGSRAWSAKNVLSSYRIPRMSPRSKSTRKSPSSLAQKRCYSYKQAPPVPDKCHVRHLPSGADGSQGVAVATIGARGFEHTEPSCRLSFADGRAGF
jgi:hypothetical protein